MGLIERIRVKAKNFKLAVFFIVSLILSLGFLSVFLFSIFTLVSIILGVLYFLLFFALIGFAFLVDVEVVE